MTTGLKAFRDVRVAPETSANGTKVDTATQRLLGTLTVPMSGRILHRPVEDRGSLFNQRRTVIVGEDLPLTFEGDLLFDSVIYLGNMGIKDISTPVGGAAPYSWGFHPGLGISGQTPKAMTFQFGDNLEQYDIEYCIARQLQFSGVMNEVVKMRAEMFGRNLEVTNWDPAAGDTGIDPNSVEVALTNKCTLFIDATTVAPGTTIKAATLLGFVMTIDTGYQPVVHGGITDIFYDAIVQGPPKVTLELTLEFNTIAEAQRVIAQAGTRQNFQITVRGTGTDYIYLMMSGVYATVDSLGEEEGLAILKFTVESEYDSGLTRFYEVGVSNSIASLA